MKPKIDLTGEKFNRLEVKSFYGRKKGHRYWNCQCECGNLSTVRESGLKTGGTKSCGCINASKVGDLTGKRFGRIEVESFYGRIKSQRYWNCKCECGNKKRIAEKSLTSGRTSSCGCLHKEIVSKFSDLTGERFERLEIKSFHGRINGYYYWNCECECGNTRTVEEHSLKTGHTKSCGCLHKESLTTHGQCINAPREVRCWNNMKDRCYNPRDISYKNYGGRGIKVCSRWLDSFNNFFEDLGRCPDGMSIERIDNNGNYEPSNVKWGTIKEQANNRRNNRPITFNGETKNLSEWASQLGIKMPTLSRRLKLWNNNVELAFTTLVKGKNNVKYINRLAHDNPE